METRNKGTPAQRANAKRLKVCLAAIAVLVVAALCFGLFGLGAYKYTVDSNGQFTNQPGIVLINFSPAFGNVGDFVTDGGSIGQEVGFYVKPFTADGSARLALSFMCFISFFAALCLAFVGFFYFINSRDAPPKIKDKYEDSIDFKRKQK